ncbi:MAG: mechanosensitive ion channel family protein [Elusimicrobiales bacterium]|nr:mechanosensitive ion channel family protein [Elusimicrobiales bacterium]
MGANSITSWFDTSLILGNTPAAYGFAAAAFAVALTLLHLVKTVGIGRLKALAEKTETDLDDIAVALIDHIHWFEYQLIAFYIATRYLQRDPAFDKALKLVILFVFTYRAIAIIQTLLSYWITKLASKRELSAEAKASVVNSTQVIMRALVWVAAILFVLENMGVNISAVLAGLGIGGVAVALASQAILGDIFNFFVILLDKPFIVGDFIVTDTISGTVEHLGLKSIRVRSLSGELLIVSNSKLLGVEVKNYKHMTRRRIVIKTSVTYQTPLEKLKLIPGMIKEAVAGLEKTAFDRSNLSGLGDFSIDFETVYLVESPDYAFHMKVQEQFLQAVIAKFGKEGIEFAYPTQTLFVNK